MIFFKTNDLIADELCESDSRRFYEICNQNFILKWMKDWEMDFNSVQKLVKHFILGYKVKNPKEHPFLFAIRLKNENKLIGICGFGSKEELNGEVEICYFIDENYSNKGYMKQIIPNAINYYFNLTKNDFLSALVNEDNIPSKKLLTSNGFLFHEVTNPNNVLQSHYRVYFTK